jgi:nucleotide-binding universal stress UspA family protein
MSVRETKMFKRILVCSDGSVCATDAVRAAAAIAHHTGTELVALRAFHPPLVAAAEMGAWVVAIDQEVIDRSIRQEKLAFEESIEPMLSHLCAPHRILLEVGPPVDTILRVAEREEVDLIIVGSRGLCGVKELILGSVSSMVMHHAHCPVMIVRGDRGPVPGGEFRHILLATDGSDRAQKAAQFAVDLAKGFATSLTVLNVSTDLSSIALPSEVEAILKEEAMLEQHSPALHADSALKLVRDTVGAIASKAGVYCSYFQTSGDPYDAIVRFASEKHHDLIVVGSRGLGGFEEMLTGSVSNSVAHHAACPVLVAH